jgi:hypothetical protein
MSRAAPRTWAHRRQRGGVLPYRVPCGVAAFYRGPAMRGRPAEVVMGGSERDDGFLPALRTWHCFGCDPNHAKGLPASR